MPFLIVCDTLRSEGGSMRKKNIGDVRIKPRNQKKKKIILITILILLLLAFLACFFFFYLNKDKNQEKESSSPNQIEEKKLTIVEEDSNRRPIAIMIDNNVGTANHVGLQDAYITYEAIVEGGLTRIMAVFKDRTTNLIGPVRSSRHYFLDYALEHDALYAHYGWSTYAERDIKALGVNNINGLYVDSAYWRDYNYAAPHNVFTNIETLYQSAEKLGYKTTSNNWEVLNYSIDPVDLNSYNTCSEEDNTCTSDVILANNITIPYSYYETRSYQYDSTRGVYLRFMNGVAHQDRDTKQQYYYKNIIIEKVNNYSLDQEGRQDLDTTGTGDGYYITNGYARPITWHKNNRSGKTTYTYLDGTEVKINDGNTFIQIAPKQQIPTFE